MYDEKMARRINNFQSKTSVTIASGVDLKKRREAFMLKLRKEKTFEGLMDKRMRTMDYLENDRMGSFHKEVSRDSPRT